MLDSWLLVAGAVGLIGALTVPFITEMRYRQTRAQFRNARRIWTQYAIALESLSIAGICLGAQAFMLSAIMKLVLSIVGTLCILTGAIGLIVTQLAESRDRGRR